jgi:hypothetical protein
MDFRWLPVVMIEPWQKKPETSRQIEIQGVVSLETVPPRELHHPEMAPSAAVSLTVAV